MNRKMPVYCIALVKILMFSTHSMKYIWYSPQKSKYPLYITTGKRDKVDRGGDINFICRCYIIIVLCVIVYLYNITTSFVRYTCSCIINNNTAGNHVTASVSIYTKM